MAQRRPDAAAREGTPSSVIVIDDHALLADTVTVALRLEGFHAEAVAPTSLSFVVDEAARLKPHAALVDLDLGRNDINGLDLIHPIAALGIVVVAFTNWDDQLLSAASIEAGAVGFVAKSSPFAAVLEALRGAIAGRLLPVEQRDDLQRCLREGRKAQAQRFARFDSLTPRERDVLAALIDGRSAGAIATESYVSIATVRSQIRAVLHKLDVNSQLEAVAVASRVGWSAETATAVIHHSPTLYL